MLKLLKFQLKPYQFQSSRTLLTSPSNYVAKLNHYELLKISRSAKQEEIHLAYLQAAKTMHPDVSQEENATEKFMEMRDAYKVLYKESSRDEYDKKTFGEKIARRLKTERSTGENNSDAENNSKFNSDKYTESGENFTDEVADLRKSIDEWEYKRTWLGRKKSAAGEKRRKAKTSDNINTNLDFQAYTEWHEWSFEFLSKRPNRAKIKIIDDRDFVRDPGQGTKNFTQSNYETPRSTLDANEEEWMEMKQQEEIAQEEDDFYNDSLQSAAIDNAMGISKGKHNKRIHHHNPKKDIENNLRTTTWKTRTGKKVSKNQLYNKMGKLKPTNFMSP